MLSPELDKMREEIRGYAKEAGLDFLEVIFEVLDWKQMNVVASYGGFPNRYPHWRFGMEYEHISKSYSYGLTKIYEMVINNDPCYAYLLHSNNLVDQKMVMAHVYGHSDFFKNNVYFAATHRKMIDEMGNHRAKVQRMINRYGIEPVEGFLDCCLSLENLIDLSRVGLPVKKPQLPADLLEEEKGKESPVVQKLPSKDYMDKFVNPREFLDTERKRQEEAARQRRIPEEPERDLLLFLSENAPLERWERELLFLIREEAYYFAPQAMTKIMNEGWAAYHHSKIMTGKALKDYELIDYADHHSGTVSPQPGKINPYKIGMELFRAIEARWNRQKIFEVRRLHNDVTFLDTFLDEEFCKEQKFFIYGYNQANSSYEIVDRDFKKVKEKLLQKLTNMGNPQVAVIDGNAFNRGELTLKHLHEGVDLRLDWAWETLKKIYRIWKKTVSIETIIEGVPKALSFDGTEQKEQRLA